MDCQTYSHCFLPDKTLPLEVTDRREQTCEVLAMLHRWERICQMKPEPGINRSRPPRIILVDDEVFIFELVEHFIGNYFQKFSLLKFRNRDEAWRELSATAPDLLITDLRSDNIPLMPGAPVEDLGMSGFHLLSLLAAIRVKFPILVASGCLSVSGMEGLAKQCAGPDLRVSYLTKPFTEELFHRGLRKCLGPGTQPHLVV
jgi:CheY-like chemotaxis protein